MKKIAIVSNNPTQKDNSESIDNCDEVVRFSKCVGLNKNTGTKTTIWITRSDSWYTHHLEQHHGPHIRHCLSSCHTAYITYGFPEYNGQGVIIGRNVVDYNTKVVTNLCADLPINCIPVNMRSTVLLHPTKNPTNGFMLLLEIMHSQLFIDYEILLYGFDFDTNSISSPHSPEWEQKFVEKWIEQGHFKKVC